MRWIKLVALAVLLFLPIRMHAEEAIPERSYELGAQYNDPVLTQKWEQNREDVYIISDGISHIPSDSPLRKVVPDPKDVRHLLCVPDSMQDIEELEQIFRISYYVVSETHPQFQSIDGSLYSKDGMTLLICPWGLCEYEFKIPEGVTTVAVKALRGGFDYLYLPSTMKECVEAVQEHGSFAGVEVHESNPYYCAVDGVLFDAAMDTLLFYPTEKPDKVYTTPDTITRIDMGAFKAANNLIHLKISDSVSKIDRFAFYCMRELERIELSSSLSVLEWGLFWGCIKLEDISFPDTITTIEMGVFNETAIYAIHIPPNVTRIEDDTFIYCENLQDVYCGENITYIEDFAFDRLSTEPLTFHVYKDSYAERYAIAHDYHIVYR